ncbi:HPF/RaiA family ribosome-associated protein [uncultured Halopseudomonas sp.]|uniref:HPF/RaiA family ribosome-associated protein n=1 Tax=uncultured Halopseudomonas sp. TaxID=2901193 RepID=UPI0030EB6F10
MQVLINSHQIETASVSFQEWVTAAVVNELERFDDFLTRVEVHVSDENGHKSGARDKRCQIEMRPRGHQPLSVTNHDESLELAVNGAAEKARHALEHLMGKLDVRGNPIKMAEASVDDEAARENRDALLEEEFLEKEQLL